MKNYSKRIIFVLLFFLNITLNMENGKWTIGFTKLYAPYSWWEDFWDNWWEENWNNDYDYVCSVCGAVNCDGHNEDFCGSCHNSISNCACCPYCGAPYCYGECLVRCDLCGALYCNGECQLPYDEDDSDMMDCNGVINGNAYYDNCGNCVGGTTGQQPCTQCQGQQCSVCGGYKDSSSGLKRATQNDCPLCICSSVDCAQSAMKVGLIYEYFMNDLLFQTFQQNATLGIEYALGLKKYMDTGIIAVENFGSGNSNSVAMTYDSGILGLTYFAGIHSHPPGMESAPSPRDLYFLLNANGENSYYNDSYIYNSNGYVYVLHVEDSNLVNEFLTNYPESSNIDPASNGFMNNTTLNSVYNNAKENFINTNNSDPGAYALSLILSQYSTGITLLKYDITNPLYNFVQLNTERNGNKYKTNTCW